MSTPLLALNNIELNFGGDALFEEVKFFVNRGEKIALVGRNGSGKSTLLKIVSGEIVPDSGEIIRAPKTTIRYLAQEPDLSNFSCVLDFVKTGLEQGDDEYRAQYLLNHLGLRGNENPENLSGGELRRAALAQVLAPKPDILLLDEPTNHLDLPSIIWLQEELQSLKSALVIISHDRKFLSSLTHKTLWVDRGKLHIINSGFDKFEAWREKFFIKEEEMRHKLDRQIVREEHWVRYGVTARRKRNTRRMSELANLRKQKSSARAREGNAQLALVKGKTSGTIVIEAKNISKSYGQKNIVDNFSTRIMRKDRVGIIGANGVGKTTLVKLLLGLVLPDEGEVKFGTNIELGLLDQHRSSLSLKTSLKDTLTGGGSDMVMLGDKSIHVMSYMKDFLFSPQQAGTPLEKLSGGERARVSLAKLLSLPSNLLVLDEPTNDLDLETLDILQEMLSEYHGTVILVSHDRDFLDRVATFIIAYEENGKWIEYAGGYSDYELQRKPKLKKNIPKNEKASLKEKPILQKPQQKKKLSFNQQYALKILPKKIEQLSKEIDILQQKLEDPEFFAKDANGFNSTSKLLIALQHELSEAEDKWLEIELQREELEGR